MQKKRNRKKGFSLVEMLITLAIMMMLILVVGRTFAVMVETYVKTDFRTKTRNDVEFISEIYTRAIRNSMFDTVYLYDSIGSRFVDNYNVTGGTSMIPDPYSTPLSEGAVGNEIHLYSTISNRITCYAFFRDEDSERDYGYFVKSSIPSYMDHAECFNSSNNEYKKNFVLLDSRKVHIKNIEIDFTSNHLGNTVFNIVVQASPSSWIGKGEIPTVSKRNVVQTSILKF